MIYLLLISSNHDEVKFTSEYCKENNYIFFFLDDREKATKFLENENINVCLVNESIVENPTEFITELREQGCNTSFIFIGEPSFNKARTLLKQGYYDFLPADYAKDEIYLVINEALENAAAFEKIKGLSEDLELTNKKLLERTNELENEKNELKRYIRILTETGDYIKEISSRRNIYDIVQTSLQYLKNYFGKNIILFTFIENYHEYIAGCININHESIKEYSWDLKNLDKTPWATSITKDKKKIEISNPLDDVYYSKSSIVNIFSGGFIKIPLVSRGKVFGTLTISNNNEDISSEDRLFLDIFSEHTAIAMDNASLNEKLEDTITELEKAQEQIVENEKLQTLANLAVSINHRINNPLCAISLNVEFLKKHFSGDEKTDKVIQSIQDNIENINKITNKISGMKKLSVKEYLPGIDMIDLDN